MAARGQRGQPSTGANRSATHIDAGLGLEGGEHVGGHPGVQALLDDGAAGAELVVRLAASHLRAAGVINAGLHPVGGQLCLKPCHCRKCEAHCDEALPVPPWALPAGTSVAAPGAVNGQRSSVRPRQPGGCARAHPLHSIRHTDVTGERGQAAVRRVAECLTRLQHGEWHGRLDVRGCTNGAGVAAANNAGRLTKPAEPLWRSLPPLLVVLAKRVRALYRMPARRWAAAAADPRDRPQLSLAPLVPDKGYTPCIGATWSSRPCRAWPRRGSAGRPTSLQAGEAPRSMPKAGVC